MHTFQSLLMYFVDGEIDCGKRDYNFFHNIYQRLRNDQPITTAQTILFRRILGKFQYSFKAINLDVDPSKVYWDKGAKIVETSSEFTNPRFFFDQDKLYLKTAYNRHFIEKMDNLEDNPFVFDKSIKTYSTNIKNISYAIRMIYPILNEYWKNLTIDPAIEKLMLEHHFYDLDKYIRKPTFKKINGNFYIIAANKPLMDVLASHTFEPTLPFLGMLTKMGVNIDPDVVENDIVKKMLTDFSYEIKFDITASGEVDLDKNKSKIEELEKVISTMIEFGVVNFYSEITTWDINQKNITKCLKDVIQNNNGLLHHNDKYFYLYRSIEETMGCVIKRDYLPNADLTINYIKDQWQMRQIKQKSGTTCFVINLNG